MKIVKEKAFGDEDLKKDEYFALMVTDHNKEDRPKEDYFNFDKAWLGVEKTSSNQIYISKKYSARRSLYRGDTIIISIDKDDNFMILLN